MKFKDWLEAIQQGTFWDQPTEDPQTAARDAVSKYDVTTLAGSRAAMSAVAVIAKQHNLSPNELWRDVVYETEPQDIESPTDKHNPTSHSSEDAFVQHLVSELETLDRAEEALRAQQSIASGEVRGNVKHAQSMIGYLEKAIAIMTQNAPKGAGKMKVRYHHEADTVPAIITGSHRDKDKIRAILGFDPQIHAGMLGKGGAACHLTREEIAMLKGKGFKVRERK